MIAVVLVMSQAWKHLLLESTSGVDVWFVVANDSHYDDEDDEDETAHNCSDSRNIRSLLCLVQISSSVKVHSKICA